MRLKSKKTLWLVASVLGVGLFWNHYSKKIPYNPGGRVDVERTLGFLNMWMAFDEKILQLDALITEYPYSNRFRVWGSSGENHASGNDVLVYDKKTEQLFWWSEWSNNRSNRSGLNYREYAKLSPAALSQMASKIKKVRSKAPDDLWIVFGLPDLQKYGAVLVRSEPD